MTLFPVSTEMTGPKHSTSVPFSSEIPVPLSVDEKEVAFVPNSSPGVAIKPLLGPQVAVEVEKCGRVHWLLLSFTLQIVIPLMFPTTVHVKVKVSSGQVGGAGMNCPATSPGEYLMHTYNLLGICDQCM